MFVPRHAKTCYGSPLLAEKTRTLPAGLRGAAGAAPAGEPWGRRGRRLAAGAGEAAAAGAGPPGGAGAGPATAGPSRPARGSIHATRGQSGPIDLWSQ